MQLINEKKSVPSFRLFNRKIHGRRKLYYRYKTVITVAATVATVMVPLQQATHYRVSLECSWQPPVAHRGLLFVTSFRYSNYRYSQLKPSLFPRTHRALDTQPEQLVQMLRFANFTTSFKLEAHVAECSLKLVKNGNEPSRPLVRCLQSGAFSRVLAFSQVLLVGCF